MATYIQTGVKISGISACVPRKNEENIQNSVFSTKEDADKFIQATGVANHRIADSLTCTSDLCEKAATELLQKINWSSSEIGILICITQTPDFHGPMNSTLLQHRLNLSKDTIAIDIPVGCSGFIYGTSVISSMMSAIGIKKGLLLVGDTLSKQASPKDKSTQPLFGDAGAAILFELTNDDDDKICFDLGNDGSGYKSLYLKDGGYRNPFNEDSLKYYETPEGLVRNGCHTIMEGMDVFSFGISTAPSTFKKVIAIANISIEQIDYALFHQANFFMNEKIRKKLGLTSDQVPYSLSKYGNTSSATIPLTLVSELQKQITTQNLKLVMCGFGIGLSWGTMYTESKNIVSLPVIEY